MRGNSTSTARAAGAAPLAILTRSPWGRVLPAALLALLLAACGGGGGGSDSGDAIAGPPTTAASLSATPAESAAAAQAAATGADAMADRSSSLSGLSALFGGAIGMQDTTAATTRHALAASPGTVQPLAAQTVTCSDFALTAPCSGSATIDASFDLNGSSAPAGSFADIRFSALSGQLAGHNMVLNGHMRIDFVTGIDLNASSFRGITMVVTLDGFGGTVSGVAYGPISDAVRFSIDSQGVITLTAKGANFGSLSGVSVTGSGAYNIASGTMREAHWGNANAYVDLKYQNWRVSANRPAVGSIATITAGSDSISVRVTASSPAAVVYAVSIVAGGTAKAYTITATYAAGSNTPSYHAVAN